MAALSAAPSADAGRTTQRRIVLACAEGGSSAVVAGRLGILRATVR